jgi:hypothetical protein
MKRLSSTLILIAVSLTFLLSAGWAAQTQKKKKTFPTPKTAVQSQTTYAGTWNGTYKSNLVDPTNVTLMFQQLGNTVTGTYLSQNGAQGVMSGTVNGSGQLVAKATQTTPTCRGTFNMVATISSGTLSWTFKGTDCLGTENGSGTATQ